MKKGFLFVCNHSSWRWSITEQVDVPSKVEICSTGAIVQYGCDSHSCSGLIHWGRPWMRTEPGLPVFLCTGNVLGVNLRLWLNEKRGRLTVLRHGNAVTRPRPNWLAVQGRLFFRGSQKWFRGTHACVRACVRDINSSGKFLRGVGVDYCVSCGQPHCQIGAALQGFGPNNDGTRTLFSSSRMMHLPFLFYSCY